MNLILLIILAAFIFSTKASAPYCIYDITKATFMDEYEDYTCQIDIDEHLDVFDDIWGPREIDDKKSNEDVKILTVMEKSKSLFNIFPSIFCQRFQNIEVIDMSDAEIEEVKGDSLKNCKNLEVVQFYRNKLSDVDENFFANNRRLKEIYLIYNKFSTLDENLFKNQHDLQILDLSANEINDLPERIFSSLQNLKTLKLDINVLGNLNPDWFKSLENLQNLDLSKNEIEELPENVFSSLSSLKTLNLGSNKLKTINSYSFDQHPQLETVSFSKNDINSIDQKFSEDNKIKTLNMKGNICSDDSKIIAKDMKRKLSQCHKNFRLYNEESITTTTTTTRRTITTTTTSKPTTTTRRQTTTTTMEPTTTTTKTTTSRRTRIISTSQRPTPAVTSQHRSDIDESACGKRPSGVPLIINGEDFDPGSYPWMAVLIVNRKVHCGGVLISKSKVITAGHCILTKALRKIEAEDISVVLGGHNLNLLHEVGRLIFNVREVHVHKNWNQYLSRYDSDIAVLMLREDVTYSDHINPICVAFPGTSEASVTNGTIVGYGKTEDTTKEFSNLPKQADTPIHKLETCIRKHPQIQSIAHHTTFCGGHGNETGACTGDSGGGLFVRIGNKFFLRGIVSASLSGTEYGCNVVAYSLFTDVTKFISWLYEIGNNSLSLRFGESPVSFVPPWIKTTPRPAQFNDRPIWI